MVFDGTSNLFFIIIKRLDRLNLGTWAEDFCKQIIDAFFVLVVSISVNETMASFWCAFRGTLGVWRCAAMTPFRTTRGKWWLWRSCSTAPRSTCETLSGRLKSSSLSSMKTSLNTKAFVTAQVLLTSSSCFSDSVYFCLETWFRKSPRTDEVRVQLFSSSRSSKPSPHHGIPSLWKSTRLPHQE